MTKPSIVFAHGLWADGSCFSKLIPTLLAEGYEVMASQHGLDSLATDVAAVKACLTRVHNPAILVGHSYGGTLITHAGTDARVAGLVYIAALAPDADETSQSLLDKFATTPVFGHIEVTDGRVWLKQSGVAHFAGDLPEAEQKLIYATQGAPVADLFNQKVEGTAWKSKPSWYVLAREDQTVHPDLQRSVSKRMKATTTEVTASHVPMLSKPDVVLDVIRKAASAVSASNANWRPPCQGRPRRKVVSLSRGGCRSAMSASGPSRHFAATRQFGRFQIKADIPRDANYRTDFMSTRPS